MQQYMLGIHQPTGVAPPEDLDRIMIELDELTREMKEAGAWVFSAALHPPESATVVRTAGDDLLMTDGPFTESKEFLGGFDIIRATDLDEALEWGGRLARVLSPLSIEVRPLAQS